MVLEERRVGAVRVQRGARRIGGGGGGGGEGLVRKAGGQ